MPVVEETEEGHRFYAEAIRHDLFRTSIALHQFAEEFQCCRFIHAQMLCNRPARLNSSNSDKTF